jgi:RNA 2',3'-cyclic 3'-phosphodiesterase
MLTAETTMQPPQRDGQSHVLFFAAVPPQAIREKFAEAWLSGGSGEDLRRNTLHMTVQCLAETKSLDAGLVERARLAASALRVAPFELCFDRLMTFGGGTGNRALVLGTDGRNDRANDLAAALHESLHEAGFMLRKRKTILPHVTLAYGVGFAETRHLAEPVRWTIRDITLIDSLQGQGRHIPLGNWPLPESCRDPSVSAGRTHCDEHRDHLGN